MKKLILLFSMCVSVSEVLASDEFTPNSGSLITNGSFEIYESGGKYGDASLDSVERGWDIFGYGNLPGWEIGNVQGVKIRKGAGLLKSFEGDSHVEMESYKILSSMGTTQSDISQMVSTELDKPYLLRLAYKPHPKDFESSSVDVYWNGKLLKTLTHVKISAVCHWEIFEFIVFGGEGQSTLQFKGSGKEDSIGGALDDVSLVRLSESELIQKQQFLLEKEAHGEAHSSTNFEQSSAEFQELQDSTLFLPEKTNVNLTYIYEGDPNNLPPIGYYAYSVADSNPLEELKKNVFFLNKNHTKWDKGTRFSLGNISDQAKLSFFSDDLLTDANKWDQNLYKSNGLVLMKHPDRAAFLLGFVADETNLSDCNIDFTPVFRITLDSYVMVEGIAKLMELPVLKNDCDGDGVMEALDAFPEDIERSFQTFYPGKDSFGFIVYEDNYPFVGDGDFNDFVVAYQNSFITNGVGEVKEVTGKYHSIARGAAYIHSFLVGLHPDESGVYKLTRKNVDGSIDVDQEVAFSPGRQDLEIFNSTHAALVDEDSPGHFANTYEDHPHQVQGQSAEMSLVFDQTMPRNDLQTIPFDPYIYIYNSHVDVHLPGNEKIENSENPADASTNFVDKNGYPWAMVLPMNWKYPLENKMIDKVYSAFNIWRESNGTQAKNWYNQEFDATQTRNFPNNYFFEDESSKTIE